MLRCVTPRQQTILDIASQLADDFSTRAGDHDRDGSFPFENYDRMREAGYLGLSVPEELGGMGASLLEMCMAQERLAMGCLLAASRPRCPSGRRRWEVRDVHRRTLPRPRHRVRRLRLLQAAREPPGCPSSPGRCHRFRRWSGRN